MSKIRINQIRSEDTVSQADAEAGTSASPKIWTPERVAQAIAALGGGGGGDIKDVVRGQKGGFTLHGRGGHDAWGLLTQPAFAYSGTSIIITDYGIGYSLSMSPNNISKVQVPEYDALFKASQRPLFSFKFSSVYANNYNITKLFGLNGTIPSTDAISTNFIGLKGTGKGNLTFVTSSANSATSTSTGVNISNVPYELIVDVSSSEVNFYLYDKDDTLLAEATHTTNIPTALMYFAPFALNTDSYSLNIVYYSMNILLRA